MYQNEDLFFLGNMLIQRCVIFKECTICHLEFQSRFSQNHAIFYFIFL